MHHLSSGESSKPQSPQKARLLGDLEDTKRSFTHKEEEMRQTNGKDAKARGYTSETKLQEKMGTYKRYNTLHALWKSRRRRRRLENAKL